MTGFSTIRAFTESYFQTDYKYIFSVNVVIIVNFKRIQIIRKEVSVLTLNKYVYLNCLRSYMKSEIYLFDKKIGKMTKKTREKQKFLYPDNVITKMRSF